MFVFLSKLLPSLIYPLNFVCMLLIAAVVFGKREKLSRALVLSALLVIFICGNRYPVTRFVHHLENSYQPFDKSQRADAIVVLGGCTESRVYPRSTVEVNGAGDRIIYGAQLFKEGFADILLVGGSYIDWKDAPSLVDGEVSSPASEMAELAEMFGVPKSRILIQNRSLNTYEESVEDAKILKAKGLNKILLVTSASHMRRSVPLFEKQGLEVIPAPTDYSYSDDQWKALNQITLKNAWDFIIPEVGNMRGLETVFKEYIGYFVYKLRGWI